jgi:hypothetical protein
MQPNDKYTMHDKINQSLVSMPRLVVPNKQKNRCTLAKAHDEHSTVQSCFDHNTAVVIAASLMHSRLGYCNSLVVNLPASQLDRPQLLTRAVTRTPNLSHISAVVKSLQWKLESEMK